VAARATSQDADDLAEVAAIDDDVDDVFDEDDAFDEDDLEEDEDLDDADDLDDAAEDLAVAEAADEGEDDEEAIDTAVVPPDAAFDDDEDDLVAAVTIDDDDADEIDGLRDGEFVCRGCYLARRDTQLADAKAMLCRDCV